MGNLYQLIPNAFTIYSDAYAAIGDIGFRAVEASNDNSPKQPALEDQLIHCSALFYELTNALVLNDDGDAIIAVNIDTAIVNSLLLQLREAAGLNALSVLPTPLTTLNFSAVVNGNYPVGGLGALLQSNGVTYLPLEMGAPGEVLTSSPTGLVWSSVVGNGIPSGGTTGQYLEKIDNTSFNVQWATLTVSKITDLTASAAELNILNGVTASTTQINYLVGVTSSIQTQLDSKVGTSLADGFILIGNASGVATAVPTSGVIGLTNTGVFSIVNGSVVDADISNAAAINRTKLATGLQYRLAVNDATGVLSDAAVITASRVLVSDLNGVPTHSGVTTTTLGFLDVSSSIQGQLDAKLTVDLTSPAQGDMLVYNGSDWINFAVGTNGQVLTSNGTIPVWGSATANGVPAGGSANQILRKIDATNYNTEWHTLVLADVTDVSTTSTELNLLSGLTVSAPVINFLSGANANIQTQLNGKLTDNLAYHAIYVGGAGSTAQQVGPGSDGSVLTIVSGHPTWQTPPTPGNVSGPVSSTDNALVRWNLTAGDSIQNSGIILDDSNNMLFPTGAAIRTSTSAGNTLLLQAYDVDGAAYVTFATLTANNTPTFDLNTDTTIGTAYLYRSGGTDVSLADGGSGASLSDPGFDAVWVWDNTTNATRLAQLSGLSYNTGTNTLTASGGGGGAVNSVSGTTDRIDIGGTASDPIVDIAATYIGQASIETLGVISVGTWQADVIDFTYGGTGLSALGTALQVIRVNSGATALEYASIAAGHTIENNGTPLTQRANLNVQNGLSAADNSPDTDLSWGGQLIGDTDIGGNSSNFSVSFGRHLGGTDLLQSFSVGVTDSGGVMISTNLSDGIYLAGSTAGSRKIRLRADQVYVNSPFVLAGYATGSLPTASDHSMGLAYDTTTNTVKFSNGTAWAALSNAGTVTSVDVSGGSTGISFSGGPITSSGTVTMAGTLVASNGGTGQSSYAVGDILYASTTTALSKLAGVATGNALISGGVNTAPSWGKITSSHVDSTVLTTSTGWQVTGTSTITTPKIVGNVLFTENSGDTITANTVVHINAGSGDIGLRVANNSNQAIFRVDNGGESRFGTGSSTYIAPGTTGTIGITGTHLIYRGGTHYFQIPGVTVTSGAAQFDIVNVNVNMSAQASTESHMFRLRTGFENSANSGAIINALTVGYTLNLTGGTTTARGIYINPVLTATTGLTHYPFVSVPTDGLNGFATATPNVTLDVNGGFALRQTTKSQITSNQNDYAIGAQTSFRVSTDASRNITGFTGGVDGKIIIIRNIGSFNLVITNEDSGSTAANRITASTGGNLTIAPNGSIVLQYDSTSARWFDVAIR